MTQQGYWEIDATNSGTVDLSGMTSLGSPSRVNITDTGNSTLLDANVTTLNGVSFTTDGTDADVANSWTSFTNGTATFSGGTFTLPALTDIDGSLLIVSEGTVTLPNLTGVSGTNPTGAEAGFGGTINLPALTQFSGVPGYLTSDGANSVLNISALTGFSGPAGVAEITPQVTDDSRLAVAQGGTLDDGSLTSLANVNLELDGTGTWSSSQLTSFTNGTLTLSGTNTVTLNLTDADGSSFEISGGATLILPDLASYAPPVDYQSTLQASGMGSVLSLPELTSLTGATTGFFSVAQVQAQAGVAVDLPALTQITGGPVVLESDGSSSVLGVPVLASFSETATDRDDEVSPALQVTNGGMLQDASLTSLVNVDATLAGTIAFPNLADLNGSSVLVEGELDLPVLASASGVNLTLDNGATLTLANAAVTMPLANAASPTINVPELPHGMILTLATTGTFTGGANINVAEGDTVQLTGGTDSVFAGTFSGGIVFAVAAGATVELGALGSLDVSGTLSGSGAGTVKLAGSGLVPAAGGLTLDFPGSMFQWTDGTIGTSLGDLTNLGIINLTGDDGINQGGIFYNYGTIAQTGFSGLSLGGGAATTTFVNESGASYRIDSDSGIDNNEGGQADVDNAGTIRKTGGPDTAELLINGALSNTGTIEADSGTLDLEANSVSQVFGNTLTGGTWNALDGATLQFPTGTNIVNNAGNIALSGAGASITGIAGLLTNSGNLTIGPGSTLAIAGNYSQTAAGTLTVQLGGTPGSSQFGQVAVNGTAALAGSFNLMIAPILLVDSTNANVSFNTSDDPNNYLQSAQMLAVAPNGPAGILRPGQSGQLTLTLLSNDAKPDDPIPLTISQIEAGQPLNLASQEAALQPSTISAAAWNVLFTNLSSTLGATTDSYNAALAQAATYLGNLGESTDAVSDVQHLYEFLVEQADAVFPTSTLGSTTDASLPTPGNLALAIDRTFDASIAGRYHEGIFGLGWSSSWEMSLSQDSSGNVSLYLGGSQASALLAPVTFFVRQANGAYLDVDGEYGTLTDSGGVFTYTDPTGIQYGFFAPGTSVSGSPGGKLSYVQDTNGNRITLGYNAQNQLITLTYANLARTSEPTEQLSLTYNGQGLVSQVADGTGAVWAYAYAAGHLLSVTAPGNLTTTYTYDTGSNGETANALVSITNPDGSQQNFAYDPATGRLASTSANGGAEAVAYTYPGEAEVTATDENNAQTITWFNDFALPARVEDPLGGISNYLYDNNGNLIDYTDADGNTYQYTYDGNGNLTQIVNPLGQTVAMTYGPRSTLTSITDADNNSTQYSYGSTGNLLSITYPDGTQQSFSYDPLGNMTDTIEQNGDPVGDEYNAQGLVTQESFADGSSQAYTYDARGNLLSASSFDTTGTLTGTTTLTYNAANELLSIAYPGGLSLTFTYNAQGQRVQSVDQSGYTINYSFDALGRLSELTDGSGDLIVQYTYNDLGQLSGKTNGNGTYTTYAYDAAGNLIDITNYAPGGSVASPGTAINSSFTYTYNLLGEQTSVTDNAGNTTTYSYDSTGQLIGVGLPGGQTITYVYNAAGDRTEVINNGTPTSYTSNSDNEITQVGSATYTYDANGNLQTMTDASGTTAYTYNDLNQLVSIANPDGSVQSFQYSPLGFTVGASTTSGGVTNQTNYLVDPTGLSNIVASYGGSGALIADYNYGLGLVSQTGPSGAGYYDFDAGGNTVGITDSTGAYVNQYSYLPFGETTTVSAALPNPFTFAGQAGVMQIGSNLFSMRARAYTPATGQFLSNDPTGLAGGDANVRRYVGNAPTTFADPSGTGPASNQESILGIMNDGPQYIIFNNNGSVTIRQQGHQPVVEPPGTQIILTPQQARDKNGQPKSPYSYPTVRLPKGTKFPNGTTEAQLPGSFQVYVEKPVTNRVAGDPNALIGPAGIGTQELIQPNAALPYTIDFENDGSVAAVDVTVTEQMDANLDWSTFQLGSFGFGPINVTIPAGLTQYQTTVSYENSDDTPLNVLVALDFNVQTGQLKVTFSSLDPATGEAPTGVFDGFLYPQAVSAAGADDGFVQYTIQPQASLPTGTTINQQASVVFDINAALATNIATNTIAAVVTQASLSEPVGTTTPATTKISTLLGTNYADPDANTKPGIAVIGTTGSGTWQYSTNGTAWTKIAAVTTTSALLLPEADLLRFLPAGTASGQAQLFYVAWDGSVGSAGSYTNASAVGDATPFSANAGMLTVTVTPVNHAPTWTASSPAFTPVLPGTYALTGAAPTGNSVSSLFAASFHDVDGNSVGIAVTGVTGTTHGTWQYSTDGGSTWTSFGSATTTFKVPTLANALLLPGTDLLRFVPSVGFTGAATLTADAWDGTQGTAAVAGATTGFKITATGGATAFSTMALTATVQINAAPTLTTAAITPFTTITEGAATTATTVAALLHDAGAGADAVGAAIVGAVGTGGSGTGTWQYQLVGTTTWTALPTVSETSAFLLPSTASVRFLSVSNQNGTATLTLRAWDGTAGSAGKLLAITATGGTTSISNMETTASLTIRAINHAPTWTGTSAPFKPELGNSTPTGDLVSDVFGSVFSDIDGNSVGVAVIGVTGTANGVWEYSLDGTVWTSFGAATTTFKIPSMTNALLLPAGDLIRFLPNANFLGTAALTVLAWDGTQGAAAAANAASGFKITATGAATAFSTGSVNAPVLVNIAPTLTTLTPAIFPAAIVEGATSTGVTVAALLAKSDASANAKGVVIVGASGTAGSGTGTWQYQLGGTTTWTNLPAASESSGFLLLNKASIRFESIANQNGTATLTFRAWDGSRGMPGTLLAIAHTGDATPFSGAEASATLTVKPINHAPTFTATSFALPAITSSTANPTGESISQLVGSSFADTDAVSHVGVAIIAATGGTTGTWQYFNGTNWLALGSPTAAAARLLAGADLVRYIPNAGFNGTATMTVRPWDGSTGTDSAIVNLAAAASVGGNTAFGTTLATITELVHDAPTLVNSAPTVSPWLPAIIEGSASAAVTVAALMHDAAVGASAKGLAIVGAAGGGNWQFLPAGSTVWTSFPGVSEASALLLPSTASIRFLSAANGHGAATLTFRAWDGTSGAADKLFAVAATGGTTSVSSAEAAVSLTVNAINHAPTWTGTGPTLTPVLPNSTPPGNTIASVFGRNFTDLDGNSLGIAITAVTGTANGTWQYSSDGVHWIAIPITGANKVSLTSALLLPGNDYVRFIPNANFLGTASLAAYAWDGTTGTAGQFADLATPRATGGNTAFSTTALTAAVLVNTAPIIE